MKFAKENLSLGNALDKEWIITNGIGGFASSTIIGANTRKYHGLLVAPIIPPAKRTLILSKLDESVEIDGRKYDLFTNIGKSYIKGKDLIGNGVRLVFLINLKIYLMFH